MAGWSVHAVPRQHVLKKTGKKTDLFSAQDREETRALRPLLLHIYSALQVVLHWIAIPCNTPISKKIFWYNKIYGINFGTSQLLEC